METIFAGLENECPIIKFKKNPNMDLFYKAVKIAEEQYIHKYFWEETTPDNITKLLENHPGARTVDPEMYNKIQNTEALYKLTDKIYDRLVFQRESSRLLNLSGFK